EVFFEIPEKRKPDLYLVSIAVAEYSNAKYNLRYTVNDGKGFVNLFNKRKNSYNSMYVDSFFNNSCTRENVLMAKERLMKSHVDDYVIIHIAGHGLLDDNLDFYFATSDIDFKNPAERGLNYEELEGLLDGIPARNKLFLMDACHSGEVDKDDEFVVENVIGDNQRGVTMFETRGETMPKTGLHNSFELMRIMFADLRKGTGAVVISAAAGGGYALENEDIENGIFTYSFMQAFKKNQADENKDGQVSVSELRNFIFDEVRRLSNGRQQTTSRRENLTNDFVIW
ncbi:MAG TPA: caspase family protein, partial [Bacteroidales bacterium]|nr:caspase family protein [Bacteroidales bacterium]